MSNIAIVDYKMGNLFSVKRACEYVGLCATITSEKAVILDADAVILPGVGAFGDAMAALQQLELVKLLLDVISSNKPFFGICLGMQLLMTESYEFGQHSGLGVFKGTVKRFTQPMEASGRILKVPQVGWNAIYSSKNGDNNGRYNGPMLEGIRDGENMYFVHSFYVIPEDKTLITSFSRYGETKFCSSIARHNVFACQFHPERSGLRGLDIYRNFALKIMSQ
ncbi:MAG: imidazole glycerol phosphate synthase subunit HisH [bacterium]|nr:imidazole glycerol phosphate synthase subunit HisH [bacterium]